MRAQEIRRSMFEMANCRHLRSFRNRRKMDRRGSAELLHSVKRSRRALKLGGVIKERHSDLCSLEWFRFLALT